MSDTPVIEKKTNSWLDHVRATQSANDLSWKEALKVAAASYTKPVKVKKVEKPAVPKKPRGRPRKKPVPVLVKVAPAPEAKPTE